MSSGAFRLGSGGSVSPIGVDISSRTISAAQVVAREKGMPPLLSCALTIERVTTGAVPGEADVKRLADRLAIAGFVGQDIAISVPDEHALTAVLELPPARSGAPIDLLALGEFARVHRREPSQLACSRWTIPAPERGKPGTYTMAVGMTHEVGEQLTDVFARGGLRVVSIDSRVCALGRCAGLASLMHDATSVDGLTGIVDLGYSRAQLVMLHMRGVTPDVTNPHDPADNAPGPRVAYERTIEAGGLTRLLQLIRTRLGLDTEAAIALLQGDGEHRPSAGVDELLRATRGMVSEYFDSFLAEVQRSMHYAAQRYPSVPLRSVWVCGPGSQVRGISEKLESLVQIPVRQLTPQKCFSIRVGSVLGSDPHVVIACGLASGVLSKPVKVLEMQHQESQSKAKEARAEAVAERSAS